MADDVRTEGSEQDPKPQGDGDPGTTAPAQGDPGDETPASDASEKTE